jgi:hypothetical protein
LGVVLVSELVSALWFEDVGFLNEQMLDTPVGRFSIRQMALFLLFGLLGWLLSLVFVDLVAKLVVGGCVFLLGAAIFSRKVKTIPPEMHLLCVLRQFLVLKLKQSKQSAHSSSLVELSSKSLLVSGSLGVPVKVVGVLKDLVTGKILGGKSFKVNINNTVHLSGVSDEEGCFCTYFVPDRFGVFQIEIQPEDAPETTQQITVNVNPKSEEKTNEINETKNNQTPT